MAKDERDKAIKAKEAEETAKVKAQIAEKAAKDAEQAAGRAVVLISTALPDARISTD